MALGAALVDRGRLVRREKTATEIDGEKQYKDAEPEKAPWFRCRLQMVKGSEQQQDGRRRRVVRPTLLLGRKTTLVKGDQVEIKCKQLFGDELQLFTIDGDPEPLRKRRTVIGFEATLSKAN